MDSPAPPPTRCPDLDTLFAHVGGYLPDAELAPLQEHLASCAACCHVVAEAMRDLGGEEPTGAPPASPSPRALPVVGEHVGRFLVMEVLGRGAMGVVYGAYDPELDRKVALKLVRWRGGAEADEPELQARLLGEAQAMARLAHPNVVAVHDLGTVQGGLYLAMEHVTGQTLRGWLAAEKRPWRDILRAFVQAGAGLAAAHAEGIVHRDFKPDNVLVDKTGRVRVTDFGLARVEVRRSPDAPLTSSDLRRTQAGTLVGTPAYMAPEQLSGATVDARADVFAFGVCLYEALYGARPYRGETLAELERSLARGTPEEPPPSKVPGWVRRVVLRALAGAPSARPASMAELLHALQADPRRRLLQIGVPLLAAAAVAGTLLGVQRIATTEARGCRASAEAAASVWSDARRERARAAFEATGKAYAGDVFATVTAAMASYLDAWRDARVGACDATHEDGVQSEALLDLRLHCLDQRLAESDALAERLAAADAGVVESAAEAVARLPAPSTCAEVERLQTRAPIPSDPKAAEQVVAAEALLAKAEAASLTGAWGQSRELARQAADRARAGGHGPTEAEALVVLAWATFSAGDMSGAEKLYEDAYPIAVAGGDDRVAARAALGRAYAVSTTTRDKVDALRWAGFAEAQAARLGADRALSVELLTRRANILFMLFEAKDAIAGLERAAALESGDEGPIQLSLLRTLAPAYQQVERYADAIATFQRALELARRTLGASHPQTLSLASNLGGCLGSAGHYRAAEDLLAATQREMERMTPGDHPDTAALLLTRGAAATGLGRFDAARDLFARATAMYGRLGEDAHGSDRLIIATLLAYSELRAGRADEADRAVAEGGRLAERYAPGHPLFSGLLAAFAARSLELRGRPEAGPLFAVLAAAPSPSLGSSEAFMLDGLGRDLLRRGRAAEAVERHRSTLAMLESHYGDRSLELAPTMADLGRALDAAGRLDEARALWERAYVLVTSEESDPLVRAEVLLGLAEATRGQDRVRATRLEAEARELARASPYPRARQLAP